MASASPDRERRSLGWGHNGAVVLGGVLPALAPSVAVVGPAGPAAAVVGPAAPAAAVVGPAAPAAAVVGPAAGSAVVAGPAAGPAAVVGPAAGKSLQFLFFKTFKQFVLKFFKLTLNYTRFMKCDNNYWKLGNNFDRFRDNYTD